jgi:hypothetical protein
LYHCFPLVTNVFTSFHPNDDPLHEPLAFVSALQNFTSCNLIDSSDTTLFMCAAFAAHHKHHWSFDFGREFHHIYNSTIEGTL